MKDDKNKSIDHHSDHETSADKKEKDLKYIKMKSINKKFNTIKEEEQKEIINNLKPINIKSIVAKLINKIAPIFLTLEISI